MVESVAKTSLWWSVGGGRGRHPGTGTDTHLTRPGRLTRPTEPSVSLPPAPPGPYLGDSDPCGVPGPSSLLPPLRLLRSPLPSMLLPPALPPSSPAPSPWQQQTPHSLTTVRAPCAGEGLVEGVWYGGLRAP